MLAGIFSFFTLSLFCQQKSQLFVSYDRYFKSNTEYKRTNGFSIGYNHKMLLNHKANIALGINVNFGYENYVYTEVNNYSKYIYPYKGLSLGLQAPIDMAIKISGTKFCMLNGITLNIGRIMNFSKYYSLDPEISSAAMPGGSMVKSRQFGYGINSGFKYQLNHSMDFMLKVNYIIYNEFSLFYLSPCYSIKF